MAGRAKGKYNFIIGVEGLLYSFPLTVWDLSLWMRNMKVRTSNLTLLPDFRPGTAAIIVILDCTRQRPPFRDCHSGL